MFLSVGLFAFFVCLFCGCLMAKCSSCLLLWRYLLPSNTFFEDICYKESLKPNEELEFKYTIPCSCFMTLSAWEWGGKKDRKAFLNLILHSPSVVAYDKKSSIWTFRSCYGSSEWICLSLYSQCWYFHWLLWLTVVSYYPWPFWLLHFRGYQH